ncbi:hypothetical protein [Kiloniella majae]|uniref:hypothetical protein n=1 Tax=Kiloniella majae TaxID=1938558 RepID=UPI000F776CC7|nr:hypothetical protein [Kiloniella majae]
MYKNSKYELEKSPLTMTIALIGLIIAVTGLIIALVGSPFAKGGYFNPILPSIDITEEYIQPNDTEIKGKYKSIVTLENIGDTAAIIESEVILLNRHQNKILNLSEDNISEKKVEFQKKSKKSFILTSNEIPVYLIFCYQATAVNSGAKIKASSAYYLKSSPTTIDSIETYYIAGRAKFKALREECISTI